MATTDFKRNVLEFYGLSTDFPTEWPAEKDNSDASDSEQDLQKQKLQRRKSRYQALERAVSNRSSVISGDKSVGSLLNRDEPDPLGGSDSVVRSLVQFGVPIKEDSRLRTKFLLSSTNFSPSLFLSQLHALDDTRLLESGLDNLSQSIDQKSASLKVLVESNFERFVRAKATIDNVYKEMKYRGAEPPSPSRARAHSRHASRSSFRNSSGGAALGANPLIPPTTPISPGFDSRKKNALVKESDYGVAGIKTPLLDVSAKAEDVWGPALGGREKEENLRTVQTSLERYKDYIEASSNVADSIKRKDYESLIEEVSRARKFADEARKLVQDLGTTTPSESQTYQILLAARMWHDVDEQIQFFKRDVWKKLITSHNPSKAENLGGRPQDQHMELIGLLLELGVDDNPIWVWLLSRYDYLKGKISSMADRAKVEIEVLRRRLANNDKPAPQTVASHLKVLGRQSVDSKPNGVDSADVTELWEKMLSFVTTLLSGQGVLGEVLEFWQTVEGFVDGRTQKSLPFGYNAESRDHHRISEQGTIDLRKGTVELVDMIRQHVLEFFAGAPPEDISLLFSPLPASPGTPMSASLTPTALRDPRFNLDPNGLPPPSPRRGEAYEKFAFWPPNSNSVSGVHYLSKMLALVGAGAAEMASISPVGQGDSKQLDLLKTLVAASRERCVNALCGAWNKDAENIKYVEDWQKSRETGDVTRMPATFAGFEGALLSGMQKILYIPEAMGKPGAGDIVPPPPTKLLQMVRSQYVTTLYKALSGMVENAERSVKKEEDEWTTDIDTPAREVGDNRASYNIGIKGIDASDRNVRMLLTLSNLAALRNKVVPSLNLQFENAFSVKLTDEAKTIRDTLSQIDARLFQTYTKPSVANLRQIIRAGLSGPERLVTSKPTQVRPYIYEALLSLVLVHSQVSTTAPSLTTQVLSFLLEATSRELLEAFKLRPRYDIVALMQATLDVEFIAQTLTQYTTERAGQTQSEIYSTLDSRTDDATRSALQSELPGMRDVLKKLRELSKNEFGCFKKPRRQQSSQGAPGVLERTQTG